MKKKLLDFIRYNGIRLRLEFNGNHTISFCVVLRPSHIVLDVTRMNNSLAETIGIVFSITFLRKRKSKVFAIRLECENEY